MAGRIDSIDGLRGIAALLVVFQHCGEHVIKLGIGVQHVDNVLTILFRDNMNFGRFGVALFFMISGFVIPFSFKGARPILAFVISRFFRLYPAYWVSLAVALLVYGLIGHHVPLTQAIANITMIQMALGLPDVIGAYWTLFTELVFYWLCAGIFFFHRKLLDSRFLLMIIGGLVMASIGLAVAASMLERATTSGLPKHLALMFLGTLARLAWLDEDPFAQNWFATAFVAVAVAIGGIIWVRYSGAQSASAYDNAFAFTAAYWLAMVVFFIGNSKKICFSPMLTWIGSISYSVYLFHGVWLDIVIFWVPFDGTIAMAMLSSVLVLAVSIINAVLVYHLIERPGIRIGHRFAAELGAGAPKVR